MFLILAGKMTKLKKAKGEKWWQKKSIFQRLAW